MLGVKTMHARHLTGLGNSFTGFELKIIRKTLYIQ